MTTVLMTGSWQTKYRIHSIADGFDELVRDNNRFLARGLASQRAAAMRAYGPSALYTGIHVGTKSGEALLWLLQGAGQGLVDIARIGESIREPSLGAFGSDVLRVLSFVPAGSATKAGKAVLFRRAKLVPGGPMSCAATSSLKATILSGRRVLHPSFVSLRQLLPGGTTVADALSPSFSGMHFQELLTGLQRIGVGFTQAGHGGTLANVANAVQNAAGPIIFRINWVGTANIPGGSHLMTAYMTPRGVRFLDQFGDAWQLTANGSLRNMMPTALGRQHNVVEYAAANISSLGLRYVIPEARTVGNLARSVSPAANVGRVLQKYAEAPYEGDLALFDNINAPIYYLNPRLARFTEALARKATGRPRPLYQWERLKELERTGPKPQKMTPRQPRFDNPYAS